MKRMALTVLIVAVLACGQAAAQSITVTKPAANDTWLKGSSYTITWTNQGQVGPAVVITLRDSADTTDVLSIEPHHQNGGSYPWPVPLSVAAGTYRVRVRASSVIGTSAMFHIAEAASGPIKVTAPNGGESWQSGVTKQITWTPGGTTGNVRIELWKSGPPDTKVGVIAPSVLATAGTYGWNVGTCQSCPAQSGAGYKVMVVPTNTSLQDASDNSFTIVAVPSAPVKVTAPNGGEPWQSGTSKQITWTPGDATGNVRIELYRNGTAPANKVGVIAPSVAAAAGTYPWTVGAYQGGTAPDGDGYKVMVSSTTPALQDASDNPFTITAQGQVGGFHAEPGQLEAPLKQLHVGAGARDAAQAAAHVIKGQYFNREGYLGSFSPSRFPPISAWGPYTVAPPGTDTVTNGHAIVGYDYHSFVWPDNGATGWVATCERSKVYFMIDQFQAQSANLISAKMHLKQVGVKRLNDTHASCAVGDAIFTALWTVWENPPIIEPAGLDFGSTDYMIDVTATVKKWLDGTRINYGFLLDSEEVAWGQQPKICGSAFDVDLILTFKND